MPAQPTTRWQISGYRFLVRRMEHALTKRDVRMLHDPMRAQSRSFAAGIIFAILGVAACALLALLRPQDKIGQNKIVIGKDTGALYALLGDTAHPVLNLASARLATGDAKNPVIVKEAELAKRGRGPLLGIPGAPAALPYDKAAKGQPWTVCDTARNDGGTEITTSVIAGQPKQGDQATAMKNTEALLVRGKEGVYLVYEGKRARINVNDRAVTEALAITGVEPRTVSEGLLNAIPKVRDIDRPNIDVFGSFPNPPIGGLRVGSVFKASLGGQDRYYVVLRDGVQSISRPTADIIHTVNSQGRSEIPQLTPDIAAAAREVSTLPVSTYPKETPTISMSRERPVACLSWKPLPKNGERRGGEIRAEVSVLAGRTLPVDSKAKMVPLAQSKHDGVKADAFYAQPGNGAFVQSTGIEPNSERKDGLFYIDDRGVRYGIKNGEAAKVLGLQSPESAPGQIIELLATGPALGREEAMIAHDGVAPDTAGTKVASPQK